MTGVRGDITPKKNVPLKNIVYRIGYSVYKEKKSPQQRGA
jgi:hypothetical protein